MQDMGTRAELFYAFQLGNKLACHHVLPRFSSIMFRELWPLNKRV